MLNKPAHFSDSWKATMYTLVAQAIFMGLTLYINYWINKNWDVEGFAAYNLLKRLSTFLLFPILLGMGIGIPKYISLQKSPNPHPAYHYLLAACALFVISFACMAGILGFFSDLLLRSFELESDQFPRLFSALLLLIFSQGLFQLLSAYFRAKLTFRASSGLHLVVMSVFPFGFLFVSPDVYRYFQLYGVISILCLMLLILLPWRKIAMNAVRIKSKMRELLKFGLPRVVGELSLFGLEFLPIFSISLYIGLKESGYMAMTFLLLKLGTVPFELYGNVMMPYVGQQWAQGNPVAVLKRIRRFQWGAFLLSVAGFTGMYFSIPPLIHRFYPELSHSIAPTQYLCMVMPFYINYLILRNVIDLLRQKAYNSINLFLALGVQLIMLTIGFHFNEAFYYQVLSIGLPFILLGVLSQYTWLMIRKQTLKEPAVTP